MQYFEFFFSYVIPTVLAPGVCFKASVRKVSLAVAIFSSESQIVRAVWAIHDFLEKANMLCFSVSPSLNPLNFKVKVHWNNRLLFSLLQLTQQTHKLSMQELVMVHLNVYSLLNNILCFLTLWRLNLSFRYYNCELW